MESKKEGFPTIGEWISQVKSLESKVMTYVKQGRVNKAVDIYVNEGHLDKAFQLLVEKGDFYKAEDLAREYDLHDVADLFKEMADLEPQPKIMS